jgi:polyferredoxin
MATSVANTGAFLGTGILQPWVGWAIDRAVQARNIGTSLTQADYQTGMWILFAFVALGFVATLYIRETYCRYVQAH